MVNNKVAATTSAAVVVGAAIANAYGSKHVSKKSREAVHEHRLPPQWHSPGVLVRWNPDYSGIDNIKKDFFAMVEKIGLRWQDLASKATPHTIVISADMSVLLDACDRISPKLQKRLKLAEEGARLGSFAPLSKRHLHRFEGAENLETFFTPRERGRLLSYMLDEEGGLINVYRDGCVKLKALQARPAPAHQRAV